MQHVHFHSYRIIDLLRQYRALIKRSDKLSEIFGVAAYGITR